MKEKFDLLLNEYLRDESALVDSNKKYYVEFVRKMPKQLYQYFDEEKYLIKASVGAGQKSEIPWLCIFNKNVTTSATQGIFICYLFKRDMSGFYLVLGQGITTFAELYGADKYKNIKRVAEYFKTIIDNNLFDRNSIDLKGTKDLAKGYEEGTIISKYYDKESYSEAELLTDLMNLKDIYDSICETVIESSYLDVVNNVMSNMDPSQVVVEEAKKIIEDALLEQEVKAEKQLIRLEQTKIPEYKRKNQYAEITKKSSRKVDYLKKAKTNAKNGLLGEELVMAYEKERLIDLGRQDLAEKIKWISKEDDGTGYDIISFHVEGSDHVEEKYIEVKSTEENDVSTFFISTNELKTMEEKKEQYFIYRVYNLKSQNPKLFILGYEDFKSKINLTVASYAAGFKESIDSKQ